MPATSFHLDPADQRQLAGGLFNHVRELLEQPGRSVADDDDMVHSAHASRYHWGQAGEPVHWARGEWLCSRVYALLGRAEPALHPAGGAWHWPPSTGSGTSTSARRTRRSRFYQVAGDSTLAAAHLARSAAGAPALPG
jgi:hypothetical protein